MRRIGTYIFWRTAIAFLAVLSTLTAIVWVTQALRRFDLVTAKGQAIVVYLGMTLLAVPFLVSLVAPFALVIAMVIVLNAMHADSELVAINAAGGSQRQMLQPFLALALIASALIGWIALYSGPMALQTLRDLTNQVRADIVANVVQPGRFVDIDDDFTFHIRNRAGDGSLEGLFIYDTRDPAFQFTYSAERGRIVEAVGRTLVVMENGTVERTRRTDLSSTFVAFGSYAFDLTELTPADTARPYQVNEQTVSQLLAAANDTPERSLRTRAEIASRIAVVLYPIAMVLAVFLFFGFPKTTRSGRNAALFGALAVAGLVRGVGFGVAGLAGADETLLALNLAVPLVMIAVFAGCILAGLEPFVPGPIVHAAEGLGAFLHRRFGGKQEGGAR